MPSTSTCPRTTGHSQPAEFSALVAAALGPSPPPRGRLSALPLLLLEAVGELLRLLLGLPEFLLAGRLRRFQCVAALLGQPVELLLGPALHVLGLLRHVEPPFTPEALARTATVFPPSCPDNLGREGANGSAPTGLVRRRPG